MTKREVAGAVARSTAQRTKPLRAASAGQLAAGYLATLKARRADVGVWEVRGRVFARVMVAARDARLSGAEWSILSTVALHLQHLGRSRGMMSIGSLADDCMVTERTVRNALRTLAAAKFIAVSFRASGQMAVTLDRRFGPKAPVPVDKSVDKSPRRCAPRKKISTTRDSMLSSLVNEQCTDSAPATTRRESPGADRKKVYSNAGPVRWKRREWCHICRLWSYDENGMVHRLSHLPPDAVSNGPPRKGATR